MEQSECDSKNASDVHLPLAFGKRVKPTNTTPDEGTSLASKTVTAKPENTDSD